MAGTERSRRRRECKLKKAWRKEAATAGPTSVHDVPDDILELVLLRVGNSLALLRAAATCKRWGRLVADAGFLYWFRSLHAPHVLGHYHTVDRRFAEALPGGNHVFVPERSPADDLDSRHLSLDFLPDGAGAWELADTRGGLVLLYKKKKWLRWPSELYFHDMVVCEPLTRRYQGILRPQGMKYTRCLGVFLIDGDAAADETGGCISMSNFRVLSAIYKSDITPGWYGYDAPPYRPRAYVFSSGVDGGWRAVEIASDGSDTVIPSIGSTSFIGRAGRSLYWGLDRFDIVLALDETTLEFSLVTIPAIVGESYGRSTFRVIGGGSDGSMRVVRLIGNDLKIFTQLQGSGGEWVMEKLVSLPAATRELPGHEMGLFNHNARIVAANERYVLVTPQEATWLFSVEVETSVVEREHERNKYAGAAYPYELPWPPVLQSCTVTAGRRRSSQ